MGDDDGISGCGFMFGVLVLGCLLALAIAVLNR